MVHPNNHFSPTLRGRGHFQRGRYPGRGSSRRYQSRSSGSGSQGMGTGTGQENIGMVHEVLFYDSLKVGRRPRKVAVYGVEHACNRRDLHGVRIFPEEKGLPEMARCLCMKCFE